MSNYEDALLQDFESDDEIEIDSDEYSEGTASRGPDAENNQSADENTNPLTDENVHDVHDNGSENNGKNNEFKNHEFINNESKNRDGHEASVILSLLSNRNSSTKVSSRLQKIDAVKPVPVSELSTVLALIPEIRQELVSAANDTDYHELLAHVTQSDESAEYRFLLALSSLPSLIQEEISHVYRYVCVNYKVVFPELETLVPSSDAYCAVVLEIGQDLASIRAHEANLKRHVSPEKVLTIVMAALQQFPRSFTLSDGDMKAVADACTACLELHSFLREIGQHIAAKLAGFAPNVTALVGPITSSQLLMSSGSLAALAQTPACNLPSLGSRELSIQHSKGSARNTGYIFHAPLLHGLPPEIVRSAQRVLSAKVVLAARMDLARSHSDGSMGRQYQQQVQEQIDRLLTPPERVKTKALPAPQEQKSKKRAGRRFRKMRERFQMSELRRAQNKVQFGKEEDHVVDGYGEEVGLGMSRQSDSVQVNRNTDARMSKAMISRLQQQKERETLDSMASTIVLAPVEKRKAEESDWGSMKKRKTD